MKAVRTTGTAVAGVLLAACAAAGDQDTVADTPQPTIALTVTVSRGEGTPTTRWELRCEPPGGDHPKVRAACATLTERSPRLFAPVPEDAACTMIYGGPQVATVTGTWGSQRVEARFTRTNGCEIARWDSVVPLLPEV